MRHGEESKKACSFGEVGCMLASFDRRTVNETKLRCSLVILAWCGRLFYSGAGMCGRRACDSASRGYRWERALALAFYIALRMSTIYPAVTMLLVRAIMALLHQLPASCPGRGLTPAIRAGMRTSKAALGKEVPRQIRAGANARADTSTQQTDRTLVSTMGSSVLPMSR
jgi:hypothetical protein